MPDVFIYRPPNGHKKLSQIIRIRLGNDKKKPHGLLSDPTSMILYLCNSD